MGRNLEVNMKILIDADGSPVVNIAISIAKEYGLDIVIVKNHAHIINDDYAEIVSVDISQDSADLYIVNHLNKGDIVVTQDYGLAALCLAKESYVINQNGMFFTEDNIDNMLNRRHIHSKMRRQGKYHSKTKKRKSESDLLFEISFRELIKARLKD